MDWNQHEGRRSTFDQVQKTHSRQQQQMERAEPQTVCILFCTATRSWKSGILDVQYMTRLFSYHIYSMPVNLSNSTDIVANSLSVINGNKVVDILISLTTTVGSPPVDLNSVEKIASSVNNDPTFRNSVVLAISPKADQSYVDA